MGDKYACEKCGSTDVEAKAWININTFKFIEWFDQEYPIYFCSKCKDETSIIPLK